MYLDGPGSTRNRDRWVAVTRAADRVLAGNRTLAEASARPERTVLVPTPVDTEHHRPGPREARRRGLMAWIGSRTNLPNLDPGAGGVSPGGRPPPGARLVVCADRSPAALPAGVEFVPWSLDAEAAILGEAEIGLMPLDDTPFNRGKCGFKILLYQAAGLAVVASPVGVNRELVAPGEDGFLPAGPDDWEEALARLAGEPDAAHRMGAAGRRRVEIAHSVAALYPRFREAVMEGP